MFIAHPVGTRSESSWSPFSISCLNEEHFRDLYRAELELRGIPVPEWEVHLPRKMLTLDNDLRREYTCVEQPKFLGLET